MKKLALVLVFFLFSCSTSLNKTTKGTLAGGTIGAGIGAIVGSQTGDAGAGTAVGAAAGALSGALIGNVFQAKDEENARLREQLDANQRQLDENKRLIDELRKRGADVRGTKRGVVINLPDVLFAFDSYSLTNEANRTVTEISQVIRETKGRMISVEGHTDSFGTVTYNKWLSEKRAQSVANSLQRNGISSQKMNVIGYGEGSPITTNNTEEGRARNRRVEVIIENSN